MGNIRWIGGLLISHVDKLMVGHFLSLSLVTSFVITSKLYFIANSLHSQIFNVMRPYYGQLFGSQNRSKLEELHIFSFSFSLLLSTFMAVIILIIKQRIYYYLGWTRLFFRRFS
jgi:Na+-driven multidrug efflux pump